jgi:hypothetical protein
MRVVAAELSAAGLDTRLHEGRDSIDVTGTAKAEPGGQEIEVIVDEDNYVELHYWSSPGATPAQVADVIARSRRHRGRAFLITPRAA